MVNTCAGYYERCEKSLDSLENRVCATTHCAGSALTLMIPVVLWDVAYANREKSGGAMPSMRNDE